MRVGVVTDSAASLPAGTAAALDITVVPLALVVDGRTHEDGDLALEEVMARLDGGVSTSNPPPGRFADAYEACLEHRDHVVVLTVAAAMSSTFAAARTAARTFGDRVTVIDTRTAAGAQGLVALAAARRAAVGGDPGAVVGAARQAIERVRLVATLPSLDRLVRSGRVPGPVGRVAGRLGLNPIFRFSQGTVRPARPALSRIAALERITAAVTTSSVAGAGLHLTAIHALAEGEARELLDRIGGRTSPASQFVSEFSPVMVSHTGPGLVGLAWWWEPDPVFPSSRADTSRRLPRPNP